MSSSDLSKMLAQGEGPHLEFKSGTRFADMAARSVVAFLNQGGGRVVLGVKDDGSAIGVPNAADVVKQLRERLTKLVQPNAPWSIEVLAVDDDRQVVTIDVPEGADKPYVTDGAIYLRRGDRTMPASRDEISDLIRQRVVAAARWERQIALGATPADLDDAMVRTTLEAAVAAGRWQSTEKDTGGFLERLGLVQGADVTNAALILYGRNPTLLLPQARVRLLVADQGKTARRGYKRDVTFESGLLKMAEEVEGALGALAGGARSEFSSTSWKRSDQVFYPPAALREGVMNALVHRDYSLNGSVLVQVLPDAIQIDNPGSLPDNMSVSDLRRSHLSLPRNPDIAHVCFLHGLIEKLGRGTQMILQECRDARLKAPKWSTSALQTSLTLFAPTGTADAGRVELTERQKLVLEVVIKLEPVKASDVAAALGQKVTERTVRSDLLALVEHGMLVRQGQGPSTTYRATASPF